ncbi:MAG: ferredoxin [Armatimonadetes bacterium]|nr:ferredoxin [Armatimonadota bacterium]
MAEVEIKIDPKRCSGEAVCVGLAPTVFRLNAQGRAEVVDAEGADPDDIVAAAKSCPQLAISVFESGSGKRLAP